MSNIFNQPLKWLPYYLDQTSHTSQITLGLSDAISLYQELELLTDYVQQSATVNFPPSNNSISTTNNNESTNVPSNKPNQFNDGNATKRTREEKTHERQHAITIPDYDDKPANKKPAKPAVSFFSAKDRFIEEVSKSLLFSP